jgi:poly(3-hydroxybutyrate) depolymerase
VRTQLKALLSAASIAVCLSVLLTRPLLATEVVTLSVASSIDQSDQPSYLVLPGDYHADQGPRPLIVSLHSWSGDFNQRNVAMEALANERGWLMLFPNSRGPNNRPEACGSLLAQRDILDALEWTKDHYRVDRQRIYLTGNSGGGHMTMLMVGRYPEVWTAASAWVGISDLAAWHERHRETNYGEMMRKVCGGRPGDGDAVDSQYRDRSPITHLHRAAGVALDIAAGVHDGHKGSVPVSHSLLAFNLIAKANGGALISDEETEQISRPEGRLENPLPGDQVVDEAFGRQVYLRRYAGAARVTIFEGGHEGIAAAAIDWFEKHPRRN